MKKNLPKNLIKKTALVAVFLIFANFFNSVKAQYCMVPTTNIQIFPTNVAQTTAVYNSGGRAFNFNATAGCSYYFATCGLAGGADTYIRLYSLANGGTALANWDDNCGAESAGTWVCPTTGAYSVLLTQYSCSSLAQNTSMTYSSNCVQTPCSAIAYGASGASSTGDEEIFNVTFGTLNNTSNCASTAPGPGSINQRYSNYTGAVAAPAVNIGSTINYGVTVGTCGGWYGVQTKIYIDYNQDGLFTGANENVATIASSNNAANTGNIIIPAGVTPGITRMRVVSVEGSVPGPTGSYTWGETEDYCINIVAGTPCSGTPAALTPSISAAQGCPNVAFTLNTSSLSAFTGLSYQWQSSPNNNGPWANVGGAGALLNTATTTTTYYQLVSTCANGGLTSITSVVSFSPLVNPCACNPYAPSIAGIAGDEEILTVSVGTMTNVSTCVSVGPGPGSIAQRYANYTYFVAAPSVCTGQVPFNITLGTCGGWYGVGMNIYVDNNQNGNFTDPGELVYSTGAAVNGVNSGFLNIPNTASVGVTRMRVVAVEGVVPGPANAYNWGETEDYCLNILPAPAVTVASGSISCGSNFTITPAGALSYTYTSPGVGGATLTGASQTYSPLANTIYTVLGSGANGCVAVNLVTVSVSNGTNMVISPLTATACPNSPFTFTASGSVTYSWTNNTYTNTANINAGGALSSITCSVIGTNSIGCTSSKTATLYAYASPTVVISPTLVTVCALTATSFTASGALTYTWANGNTGSTSAYTPSATSQFTVQGSDANGCNSSASAIVLTNPAPPMSIIASSSLVCASTSLTLSGSGANTFTWSVGGNNANVIVTPTSSTVYTLSGTGANNCVGNATINITTNPSPILVITPPSASICLGSSSSFSVNGAISYTWSNGSNNNTQNLSPSSSTVYSVSAEDSFGCIGNNTLSITVNPLPVIIINPSAPEICRGEIATVTSSGAATYTWMPGNVVANTFTDSPLSTGFYSVTGTDNNSCKNNLAFLIKVNSCTGIEANTNALQNTFIFPNPTKGLFTAKFEFDGEKTISVIDGLGKLIVKSTTQNTSETFNLTGYAKGIYIVKIDTKLGSANYKLVIE